MAFDHNEFNRRKPVLHVRFRDVDEWALVVDAAARRGLTLCGYLRTIALEDASHGSQSRNRETYRALATPRST